MHGVSKTDTASGDKAASKQLQLLQEKQFSPLPVLFNPAVCLLRAYWLLGLAVGDGVAAGAGVVLKVRFRIFQSSPSRITVQ